jgi:hypothetical protein
MMAHLSLIVASQPITLNFQLVPLKMVKDCLITGPPDLSAVPP